ncbi:hypothetical protein ACO0M4_28875 [Streptomyces sp. RGM 3693]|uniref:hypothetical protein n=1 Tax=Streptomyces sp. RGM 3693 TaxID=3413284 RepID=UPI003D2974CA
MDQLTVATLADRLVRRHPDRDRLGSATASLAESLVELGRRSPAGSCLIIGGSLSRGEPCIRASAGAWTLHSDLDLLLVHDDVLPPVLPATFSSFLENELPNADVMTLSSGQFAALDTSLGYDFKENGIVLSEGSVPAFESTSITPRDAREILAYTIFIYLWEALGLRSAQGEVSADLDYSYCRLTLKALRTVVMLHGGYAYHFDGELPDDLRRLLTSELAAHDALDNVPVLPAERFLPVMSLALEAHTARFGVGPMDAVSGTEYQGRPGSDYVTVHQQLAFEYMGALVRETDGGADQSKLPFLLQDVWRQVMARHPEIKAAETPAAYFERNKRSIQQTLLMMKLPAAPASQL